MGTDESIVKKQELLPQISCAAAAKRKQTKTTTTPPQLSFIVTETLQAVFPATTGQ